MWTNEKKDFNEEVREWVGNGHSKETVDDTKSALVWWLTNSNLNQMILNFNDYWNLKGEYREKILKEMDVLVAQGEKGLLSDASRQYVFALVVFAIKKWKKFNTLPWSSSHRLLENPKKWAKILLDDNDYRKYELIAEKYAGSQDLEHEWLEHLYRALYSFIKGNDSPYAPLYGNANIQIFWESIMWGRDYVEEIDFDTEYKWPDSSQ